jgi:hypothetical protein
MQNIKNLMTSSTIAGRLKNHLNATAAQLKNMTYVDKNMSLV